MRVGIDGRLAGLRHAGIGRYVATLMAWLPRLNSDIEWVYFFHDKSQSQEVLQDLTPAIRQKIKVILVPVRHYSLVEQLRLPGIFGREKLDVLHVPHFNIPIWYRGQLVVTIHDLLWHEYKGTQVTTLPMGVYWFKYAAYRCVAGRAIHKAQVILVPAETIKKVIARYYPEAIDKVKITLEGVGADWAWWGRQTKAFLIKKKWQLQSPYLVYVGSLYPHKNMALVVEALAQLPDHRLVIVGVRTVFQAELQQQISKWGVAKRVVFTGYLADDELAQLLKSAQALVQPSLSEGFGLTGVEAMAVGTPVIASDIPIFREIYQQAALFFDPESVLGFVAAVKSLTTSQRQKLIKAGRTLAARYNWQRTAQQTLDAYQTVYSSK